MLAIAVFCSALCIHLLHIAMADWGTALLSPYAVSDAYMHLHRAWYAAFVNGDGGFAARVVPDAPYVWLLTGAYRLFGPYAFVPFLVNAILASLAAAFAALTARRLFDDATGWCTGIVLALLGPWIFFAGITVKTSLVVGLLSAAVYFAVLYFYSRRWWQLFLASLFLALCLLDRNNVALLWLLLALLVLWLGYKAAGWRSAFTRAGVMLAGIILIVSITNWKASRLEQDFFSPIGLNFYVGNAPGSRGGYTPIEELGDDIIGHFTAGQKVAEQALGRPLSRWQASRYWIKKSFDYYWQHPGEYALLQLRKLGMLLAQTAPGLPEVYRVWRWQRPALWLAFVDFGLLLSLALTGLYAARRRLKEPPLVFLVAGSVIYACSFWLFFISERYRMPLAVLMAPFSGYGVRWLINSSGRERIKPAIAVIGIYTLSVFLTGVNHYGVGWPRYEAQFLRQEARRAKVQNPIYRLKQQAVVLPTSAVWAELSRHFAGRGFSPDAQVYADKAIALDPGAAAGYEAKYRALGLARDPQGLALLYRTVKRAQANNALEAKKLRDLDRRIGRNRTNRPPK